MRNRICLKNNLFVFEKRKELFKIGKTRKKRQKQYLENKLPLLYVCLDVDLLVYKYQENTFERRNIIKIKT